MGGWVGQLGWVGGLPGPEAAPQGPPAPPPPVAKQRSGSEALDLPSTTLANPLQVHVVHRTGFDEEVVQVVQQTCVPFRGTVAVPLEYTLELSETALDTLQSRTGHLFVFGLRTAQELQVRALQSAHKKDL